jgi:hypothetical protein
MVTDYKVGDRVVITEATLKVMWNGNRSIKAYPCGSYIQLAKANVGIPGTVTHRFRPGYEMTVELDNGQRFHMKDNYVERTR